MAGPAIYDIQTLIQAGIDPKTKLPIKMGSYDEGAYKQEFKKQLRIMDEQKAINRYVWYNLPFDLTSQELERLLYYKYSLCPVWDPVQEKFFIMPYALDGGIDFYGRMVQVHPIPVADGANAPKDVKSNIERQRAYLSTLKLKVLYDIPDEVFDEEKAANFDPTKYTVILRDYTPQLSITSDIPRWLLQDKLVDVMADCIPFMRTSLLNSTGVLGMRVNSRDEASNVIAANQSLTSAALKGNRYVPIEAMVELQELTGSSAQTAQEFMLAYQALSNYQDTIYGIQNNGVMQKASHMLESEQAMNKASSSLVTDDGLAWRQWFCNMCNILYGFNMWCDLSPSIVNTGEGGMPLNNGMEQEGVEQTSEGETSNE